MSDDTKIDEAESHRRFIERLSDWSEPGAVTIIRDGVPLTNDQFITIEPSTPFVVSTDDDGNLRMSDGTIRVPRGE